MSQFYIDESIHDEAGFIIGACVYTNVDIDKKINKIIKSNGLDPSNFEHKSGAKLLNDKNRLNVRNYLKDLLNESCNIGIVVIPREKRDVLGLECIKAVEQFIKSNTLTDSINIYFDQGIFNKLNKPNSLIKSLNFINCSFFLEQDSKKVKGIQLADLAAHIASIQLKDALGLVTKKIKAGKNSRYGDVYIELGFEMWATIRYTFFNEQIKSITGNLIEDATLRVEPYGLYISDFCDEKLARIAREKFGDMYLGCIH